MKTHKHLFLQWITFILIFALGFLTAMLIFNDHNSSLLQTNLTNQVPDNQPQIPERLTPHVDLSKLRK